MFNFLFNNNDSDTVYLRHFYGSSFTGDTIQEETRELKVAKVIKQMGNKWLLATPITRATPTQEK